MSKEGAIEAAGFGSAAQAARNEERAFQTGRIILVLSIVGHAFQVLLFLWLERPPLTWLNVVSVVVLAFALWRLQLARNIQLAWWLFIGELLVNNVIVTVVLGVQAGFMVYPMIGIGIGSAIPFTGQRIRVVALLISFAVILAAIGVTASMRPLQPFETLQTARILTGNLINMAIGTAAVLWFYSRAITLAEDALEREFERSEGLLLSILPATIAQRLKSGERTIADTYPDVTVLFADIAGFTEEASRMPATDLVQLLDEVFARFDTLAEEAGVEKIKTIGDAYMAVAGLPEPRRDHADVAARLALDMLAAAKQIRLPSGGTLQVRIGLHSGSLVGGVIGEKRMTFDLWGDVVNTASRMESGGEAGKVQISQATRDRLSDRFHPVERGLVEIKGKGAMRTWLLEPN